MAVKPGRTVPKAPTAPVDPTLAERLERGELIYYPTCPFPLPEGKDREFLLEQRQGGGHKNISYDPCRDKAAGFQHVSPAQAERFRDLLADFSRVATTWVSGVLPRYAHSWQLDRVSYRPQEEATRRLRLTARNDLLHVDAFPSRPTNGSRILRLFVNVNPTEPRVWVTSDPFAQLLERYGEKVGLPHNTGLGWKHWFRREVLGIFQAQRRNQSVYDEFMQRFHDFLKSNDDFQERCVKHYWNFAPNSAWLVMTDAASHAVLRGRYALEHSYFVAPESLAMPMESPPALLARACGFAVLNKAA